MTGYRVRAQICVAAAIYRKTLIDAPVKALRALPLFSLWVFAPLVSAQPPGSAEPDLKAARAALVEEVRERILWYDEEKRRPILIPAEAFGKLPFGEFLEPAEEESISLWIARQRKELAKDPTAEPPCFFPGTAAHRLTPGKKRMALEEAMAAPLAVMLVSVDRTTLGVRPNLGIYQYNEVTIVDLLLGAGGRDQNPLSTRAFLSEGGTLEIDGTPLCTKSPWHAEAPQSGDEYLLIGAPDIYGIFNAVHYLRVDGGNVVPAKYSELKFPESPLPLARVWAAADRLRKAEPPVPRFRLLPSGEKPRDPAEREIPNPARRPSGPGGQGQIDAAVFCEAFQGLCDGSIHLAWRSQDDCTAECDSRSHFGDKASSCHWKCGPEPGPPTWERERGTQGNGPHLALLNLRDGDVLAGRPVLRGYSMTYLGKISIDFFWNGRRVSLRGLKTGLPSPEACTSPLGWLHSACAQESGFEVEIDSTLLPNGPGRLALLSSTDDGWTSSLELDLVVANEN